MSAPYTHLDPFLSKDDADNMLRIAERFGSFGTYADEATSEGLGEELPQQSAPPRPERHAHRHLLAARGRP